MSIKVTVTKGNPQTPIYRSLVGVILIGVGLLFFADRMFDFDSGGFGTWWPLILVSFGLWGLGDAVRGSNRSGSMLMLLVGCAFLFKPILRLVTGDADFVDDFRFWPLIIVAIGGAMVWRALVPPTRIKGDTRTKETNDES